MDNAGLDKPRTRIKIAGRNINNLSYADDATLVSEIKEELKSLLMRGGEESGKGDLKPNILKYCHLFLTVRGWMLRFKQQIWKEAFVLRP